MNPTETYRLAELIAKSSLPHQTKSALIGILEENSVISLSQFTGYDVQEDTDCPDISPKSW